MKTRERQKLKLAAWLSRGTSTLEIAAFAINCSQRQTLKLLRSEPTRFTIQCLPADLGWRVGLREETTADER